MKLLILCMSMFLLALTPAKQVKKVSDKYNTAGVARKLSDVDSNIKDAASKGEYYIDYCIFMNKKDLDKVIISIKRQGYAVTKIVQDKYTCYGTGVENLRISWYE